MNSIPLCNHIMPNGNTCGSPAMRNQRFCYFHNEQQKRTTRIKRARHPQSSHACPFHPDVAIRRKKCPIFLAAMNQDSVPATCDPRPATCDVQPATRNVRPATRDIVIDSPTRYSLLGTGY